MGKRLDIKPGDRFSRLTIIKEVEGQYWGKYKHRQFLCKCDCENETTVRLEYLRSEHTTSCGCNRELISFKSRKTHGMSGTNFYNKWASMVRRCRDKSDTNCKNYGARGIKVCVEWLEFEPFHDWAMVNGYEEGLTIERKDVNGNYEPGNCEWISRSMQARNKRNNHLITYDGETKTLIEWAEELQINYGTLYSRISYGWTIDRAFNLPVRNDGKQHVS
jgi:hypothetical protein